MTDYLALIEGMTDEIRGAFKQVEKALKSGSIDIDEALSRMKDFFRDDSLISATFDTPKEAYLFYAGDSGYEKTYFDLDEKAIKTVVIKAWQVVDAMAQNNPNYATISQTQAGKILWDDNFNKYLKSLGLTPEQVKTHLSDADNGFWRAASDNYARNAKGSVITVTPFAGSNTVYYKGELIELLRNNNITDINGESMADLQNTYKSLCTVFNEEFALKKVNQMTAASCVKNNAKNSHIKLEVDLNNEKLTLTAHDLHNAALNHSRALTKAGRRLHR